MALEYNVQSLRRELVPSGTWGNEIVNSGSYTFAAAADTEQAALVKIPANCVITDAVLYNAALGATTGVLVKLVDMAGTDIAGGTLVTDADTAAAGRTGMDAIANVEVTEDAYIVLENNTANAITGLVEVTVRYQYKNK